MSRRHEASVKTGVRKEDRLNEHRRDRRAARQMIPHVDPEDAVLPGEGPAHLHAHRSLPLKAAPVRHWKLPFWKRRGAVRATRARAERLDAELNF